MRKTNKWYWHQMIRTFYAVTADALNRWVMAKEDERRGAWELSPGRWFADAETNVGLRTTQDAYFYGASCKLRKPFSNKNRTLVIQFNVKHEQSIDCGGGYVKLFDCSLNQKQMDGHSSYLIMFGPDICGPGTKKVHAIISYKGKNHKIKKDVRCKDDVFSHLYTLIIRPDQTYEIRIDNEKVESGELENDWDFLPPKTIKDPKAKKPENWDDRAKIEDPDDVKPEHWDLPQFIVDPEAQKPADWNDQMDGEWEPPQIKNPDYKEEWKPKMIDNPNYKGMWVQPEIQNPEYRPDKEIYLQKEICYVGFDLWQVKAGSIFDNIVITDDPDFAHEYSLETWGYFIGAEKQAKEDYEATEKARADAKAREKKDQTKKKNQNDDYSDDTNHDEL